MQLRTSAGEFLGALEPMCDAFVCALGGLNRTLPVLLLVGMYSVYSASFPDVEFYHGQYANR
jgi:hypothetical protein